MAFPASLHDSFQRKITTQKWSYPCQPLMVACRMMGSARVLGGTANPHRFLPVS
jgi:hypothetical protein